MDLDLACEKKESVNRLLQKLEFKKYGRHWHREDLDLAVGVPSATLTGSEERLTKVEVDGLVAYVIEVEDIIADRLNAYVHWGSEEDGRWARRIMVLHRDKIDWAYLEGRSKKEKIYEALRKLKEEGSRGGRIQAVP